MAENAFELTLEFHGVEPSNEPVGDTIALVVADGALHRLVTAGEVASREPFHPDDAARELARAFGKRDVERALSVVAQLQSALEDVR